MSIEAKDAGSASTVNETQAGAQTGASQAGAGSANQGAQTGTGQAGAGAAYQSSGAETISDVGQAEAYIAQVKRIVARELDTDAHIQQILIAKAQRDATANGDFDGQLRNLALQSLQNSVTLANRVNNDAATHGKNMDSHVVAEKERTVRNGDVLDVIREAGVSADTTVYQDVLEVLATKVAAKLAK